MMLKIAIFFFSGTGNTYFVAKQLCDQFRISERCDLYSIEKHLQDGEDIISKYDLIGLAYPIYGSSVPYIVSDFIDHLEEHSLPAFVICTQMMFSGDGAAYGGRLLEKKGFHSLWQEHFDMPNNISDLRFLTSHRLPHYERIQSRVEKKSIRFARRVLSGKPKKKGSNVLSLLLGLMQRGPFEAIDKSVYQQSLRINENKCNLCQKCVLICPVQNLEKADNKILIHDHCTLCYRCVNQCPEKAIYMINKLGVKHPYHGPEEHFNIGNVMKDDLQS